MQLPAFRFEGNWKDDLKEGRGRCTWKNGDVFEGNYSNDLPEGEGTFKSKSKE